MQHFKIIKRAFEITWRYRALWVFGVIVALLTSRGGSNNGGGGGGSSAQTAFSGGGMPFREIPAPALGVLVGVAIALFLFFLIVALALAIARYVSANALIQMVDRHEESGEKVSVWQGFRLGWSRPAWRFFLIDLTLIIPTIIVFTLAFLPALAPLLAWITESVILQVVGTVLSIGLTFLVVLLFILVIIALSLLRHFALRAAALEGLPVFPALHEGYRMVREHLDDVVLMGLIMFGIRIALTVVFIPVIILLVLAGIVLGVLPGVLAGLLTFAVAGEGALPWIVGFIVGLPLFLLVVGVPSLFLGGLVETFKSTTWTLTYRELRVLESLEGETEPFEPVEPGLDVEPWESNEDEFLESDEGDELVTSDEDKEFAGSGEDDEPAPSVEWDSAPSA
ncbi:MAG: hypothetical protein ACLFU8_06250 [Anaerolineales bacterium]